MRTRNLFWGVFFILAAIGIVLSQFGMLGGVSVINLIFTILLIAVIIKSIVHINFFGILVPLSIIGIIYSEQLGLIDMQPWTILGAAIFLSIGLSIIFRSKHYRHKFEEGEYVTESISQTEDGIVNLFTRFAGSIKYINSENLKQANLDCSFGSMKVYFNNSKIENKAEINLNVEFSGVELFIPKQWEVIDNVNCTFGGIDEKNKPEPTGDKKIILKGETSFSGVEIVYI